VLEKEIALTENPTSKLVENTPNLQKSIQIVTSAEGVGNVTAWPLAGSTPNSGGTDSTFPLLLKQQQGTVRSQFAHAIETATL